MMHHNAIQKGSNQWGCWANTKGWAHHISSSDSGFPTCPTEHCCYPKFVQRIEFKQYGLYYYSLRSVLASQNLSGRELLSCKRERERDREMIFQSQIPMLSLLLYDFDIPFFNKMCFTYFVHTFRSTALRSEKRHHLMINGSIVLLWL